MALPTEKQSRATRSPLDARIMLAGTPKSGKTTLASSWAPDTTLLIDTQGGTALLDGEHFVQPVASWPEFVAVVNDLVAGNHRFRTVVIDMVDDLWNFVDAHHAGRGRPLATATDDYNKAAKAAEGVFRHEVGRLLRTGLGIWFLTHTRAVDDDGVTRYVAKLDGKVLTYVQGACEFVLLAETLGPKRLLHTQPSAKFECGTRVPLPEPMDLNARVLFEAMRAGLSPRPVRAVPNDETPKENAA
jgi:hypothetical protein